MTANPLHAELSAPELPDGIYFDLDAERYRADPALGSTDMKNLAGDPYDWWFRSRRNPNRPPEHDTTALRFGRAVHCMALEGRATFERHFAMTDGPARTKEKREERLAMEAQGKQLLSPEEWNRALLAGTYIKANPSLERAFAQGRAEVSVVWTRDGIRRKARFDYLKAGSIVDLKSARHQDEYDFKTFCKREIVKRSYFVQMAHYLEARAAMKALWDSGRVNTTITGRPAGSAWMRRVIEEPDPTWVWVFYQSGSTPKTYGAYINQPRQDPLYASGVSEIELATYNYNKLGAEFGELPWVEHVELERLDVSDVPEYLWRRR